MQKMKKFLKTNIQLFTTGFVQVYFVAINTCFLAKEMYLGVLIASFAISMIWSFNIKRLAFGSKTDRIIYALGATIGSIIGLFTSSLIIKL
jgi:hypothetical protein